MKYDMGIRDRLVLLAVLPRESALATIRIVNDLRLALSPDEAEYKDLQMIEVEGGGVKWSDKAAQAAGPREFEVGAKGQEIIRAALGKLDKDEKLTTEHIAICDLFEYTS